MTGVAVLVNGASASGKSRLIAGIEAISRDAGVLREVVLAKRYTTREARENESLPSENCHMDPMQFEAADGDLLDVTWRRKISPHRDIRYGFALRREITAGGIVILSGNNYLDWTEQPVLRGLRLEGRLMVVRVWATDSTRRARLAARKPSLSEEELTSRMGDLPPSLLPPADHVIPNDEQFEPFAQWEFMRLAANFWFLRLAGQPPLEIAA